MNAPALAALATAWFVAATPPALAQAQPAAVDTAPPSADAATATRILVIPYQPIFRSAEQRKANKATEYLNQELGSKASIEVLRAGVSVEGQARPSIEAAVSALERAKKAEAEHRIDDAITARQEAISLMEQNAAAIPEAEDYILAHHRLARAYMWRGRDDEARQTMMAAAAMDPNMQLEASEFSRLYRTWYRAMRKELRSAGRGQVLVRSVLPGATISIDGREMDTAPVRLQDVVPGKHILSATAEGAEPTRAVIEVKAGSESEYTIAFGETVGGPTIGKVADSITENTLSADAVTAAQKAGQSADASYVVLGGLAKDEDHFNVHTFVVDVPTGKMKQLDVTQFDLDLLTAESDVLRVVLGVEQAVDAFDGAIASAATIEQRIRRAEVVNSVNAEPDLSVQRKRTAPKQPTRRRGPIRAVQDIDIEDD
jgi:hypothetical protein